MPRVTILFFLGLIVFLSALFGVGSVIALNFELTGFGRPADAEPRMFYIASLVVSLVLCVLAPLYSIKVLAPLYSIKKFGVRKPSNREIPPNINESLR